MEPRVLVVHGPHERDHLVPAGHPEGPARLDAVRRGIEAVGQRHIEEIIGRPATRADVELVHTPGHIEQIQKLARRGGGPIDDDTYVSRGTYDAALGAAGTGLEAVRRLGGGGQTAAFAATRPPGHHAGPASAEGFCYFNNVAVAAAHLADLGNRVTIIDWDAHHGNGTQDIFWSDDRIQFVSIHQESLYPGTGLPHERGPRSGRLTTMNLPLPAGATGDRYLSLLDDLVASNVARFEPDWILVSCGFDAHTADPLARMALVADDFALLTERVDTLAPRPGRLVLFLEGGYDLEAVEACTAAVVATLAGTGTSHRTPSAGGPGEERLAELRRLWA